MFVVSIPGFADLKIRYLVLDLNGTLVNDGVLEEETAFLAKLVRDTYNLKLYIVTAATRGLPVEIAKKIDAEIKVIEGEEALEKEKFVLSLGSENVCAIGNGSNDALMLKTAALGICILGDEGTSVKAMMNADVMVKSINDAFRLFLHPKRLIASLRS
jgi:soluble P-type ATPase